MALTERKIVVVGSGFVGKTSLILAGCDGPEFGDANYMPISEVTGLDILEKIVDVNGEQIKLSLYDTGGLQDYQTDLLRQTSYPNTDAILMCFSFDSTCSLWLIANEWMPEVARFCPDVPIILVGNKVDLKCRDNPNTVTTEEVQKVIDKLEPYAYFESSVLKRQGVDIIFTTAARAALERKQVVTKDKQREQSNDQGSQQECCCIVS